MTRLLSSEELAASAKFKLVQKGTGALVSRSRKAAEFYGDHVEALMYNIPISNFKELCSKLLAVK